MRGFLAIVLALGAAMATAADEAPRTPIEAAAEEGSLTLEAAVQAALERAPELAAAQAGVDSANAMATSAGRLPDPALIVGLENLPVNGPDAYSTTADFMTMRTVGVMQEFPRAEKRRLRYQRAESEVTLAAAQLADTQLSIARQVAEAWIMAATANTTLESLQKLQPDIALGVVTSRAAVSVGRASAADALAAEAALARLKSRILEKQGESRRARIALARWIGDAARRPLAATPAFDRLPAPAETLLATTHLHASIVPYDARLEAARSEVALARAERRPDWSAQISFAKRGPDFSDMASLQFTVGLPFFAKYRQNPVIAARSADVRRIEAERESEVRMHTAELEQAIVEWQQFGEQLAQYDGELLPLARERTRVTLAAYRAGTLELEALIESLEEETNLLVEQASLASSRGRAWAELRYLEAQHLHAFSGGTP